MKKKHYKFKKKKIETDSQSWAGDATVGDEDSKERVRIENEALKEKHKIKSRIRRTKKDK